MKTPISYYGGKQTLLKHILPLIPSINFIQRLSAAVLQYCLPSVRLMAKL